jgi:hypothetical protein
MKDMLRVPVEVELQKTLVEVELQRALEVVRLPVDLTEVQLPGGPREVSLPEDPVGRLMLKPLGHVQRVTGITFMALAGTNLSLSPQPVLRWGSRILYLLVRPLLWWRDRPIT